MSEIAQYSHSRVESFKNCPHKYKLHYIDKLKTLPNDDPTNALFLGTALHTGLQKSVQEAIKEYYNFYPVIDDRHVNEAIKLEYLIPRAKELLPPGQAEIQIDHPDYVGFMDWLTVATVFERGVELPNQFDLYDFKYSNNVSNYMDSDQLHLYKYFFELTHPGKKIRDMYFLFVPKVNIKQKKTEDLQQFRNRIMEELKKVEPKLVQIEYDATKVIDYLLSVKTVLEATEYPKNEGWLCNYCEYQEFCQKGIDIMILPSKERRNIETLEKKVVWLYGSPFSGKTTFANKFPDPLMLNTDGNIKFVDAPFVPIRDEITTTGRVTNKKLAWSVFKETIGELEKKQNDFKTIVVDLLEDTYEYCRLYMYDQMGITHESDDSFRAWDKVRTEFLSTLKRLMALDYENIILISHEDTSKDITKKGGDKVTSIKPNLQDKAANKVAGMVDIVARVIADDTKRVLSFKTNEVIFGGGRLTTSTNEIDLDYDIFLNVYAEANKAAVSVMKGETKPATQSTGRQSRKPVEDKEETVEEINQKLADAAKKIDEGQSASSTRRSRNITPTENSASETTGNDTGTTGQGVSDTASDNQENAVQEQPTQRTRRSRTVEPTRDGQGFMNIPDGIDEGLPFGDEGKVQEPTTRTRRTRG